MSAGVECRLQEEIGEWTLFGPRKSKVGVRPNFRVFSPHGQVT